MKKVLAMILCGALLVSAVACGAKPQSTSTDTGYTSASEGINRKSVAATVGNHKILAGDVADQYDSYVEMYSYYGYEAPSTDADIESLQDQVLDELISNEVKLYMAEELGLDKLSEDQEVELKDTVEKEKATLLEIYSEDAADDASEEEIMKAAIETINEELEANGFDMDFEGYIKYIEDYYRESYVLSNLEDAIKSKATISDDKVQAKFDSLVAEQKEALAADPNAYLSLEMAYEKGGTDPVVSVPEGYARIKVLTISPKEALSDEYNTVLDEMEVLEAEYGNLVLSGSNDYARINEIKNQYKEKKATADALMDAHLSEAKTRANEALSKAQLEGFEAAFDAYNEDSTYTDYGLIKERGYLIRLTDNDGYWEDEIRQAAKKLKPGEFSNVIRIDDEFHIVYKVSEETPGDITFDQIKDAIKESALVEAQETLWQQQQEEWENDSSVVKRHEDVYRKIGKAA